MASSTAGQGLSEASWTDRHAEKQSQCQCSGRWRRWLHISESFQNISLRVREFLSLSLSAAAASVRWISLGLSLGPRHACAAQQAVPPPPHPENSLSVPPGRHSLSSRCVWRLVVARAHPEYQCLQKSRERSYTRTSVGGRTVGRGVTRRTTDAFTFHTLSSPMSSFSLSAAGVILPTSSIIDVVPIDAGGKSFRERPAHTAAPPTTTSTPPAPPPIVAVTNVSGLLGRNARLPCDTSPPGSDHPLLLVIWFKEPSTDPVYR